MNQCVPSWDLDFQPRPPSNSSNSLPLHVPSCRLDYEVAELTWENGQLAMHGLGPPRQLVNSEWDKPPAAGGTLESLVDQATRPALPHHKSGDNGHDLAPWFDYHRAGAASAGVTLDALVPCDNNHGTCVGSCSGATAASLDTCGGRQHSRQATTFDTTCEKELGSGGGGGGFTSPSLVSAENTTTSAGGKEYTKTSGDDHDSGCHSRSQRGPGNEEARKKGSGKSSVSTKRSRAAAIHNQSERKRRDRINDRMRTLQKLVPNSSKTDKASMLDEVIEYLKQLQTQVQLMSRMVPLAMQQMSSVFNPMGIKMGMGMPMPMPMPPLVPPLVPLQSPWDNPGADPMPVIPDPFLAFLACQSQPMNMEAHTRLAAMYQQIQSSLGSDPAFGLKN